MGDQAITKTLIQPAPRLPRVPRKMVFMTVLVQLDEAEAWTIVPTGTLELYGSGSFVKRKLLVDLRATPDMEHRIGDPTPEDIWYTALS